MEINYKYDEKRILGEIEAYIDITYHQHYSNGDTQTLDTIIGAGHGEGFCLGNIIKYATRYGKKGGKNPQDLMKMIHYAMVLLSEESKKAPE